jgi:hypothetical protein
MNKKTIFVVVLILIVAGIMAFNIRKAIITANTIKEQQEQEKYESWLAENCECIESNRLFCSERFELVGNICRDEERHLITNPFLGCSKYDCEGEIHEFNFEEEKWQKEK